jgi:hypothetical protein
LTHHVAELRDFGATQHMTRAARLINARSLLDHLVGAPEQRQRDGETERLGGLEIDNELDFCKQLDRQV